jgi:hypothetical protein
MFDTDSCRLWAKEASDAFINNGTPLGDSIAKVAKKNSLNPNQIQRVVELANSITHGRLFQKEKDKTFTFPLAKLDDILTKVKGETTVKVAEAYNAMPDIQRTVESDKIAGLFNNPEKLDLTKIASKKTLLVYQEKMAAALDDLNSSLILADVNAVQYLKGVKEVVKQLLLDSYSFEDLFSAMVGAMPEKKQELLTLFTDIAKELSSEGVKLAEMSVEPEYISKLLKEQGVKVVNGQHPLYMNVSNYFTEKEKADQVQKGMEWLSHKLDELKKAIKHAA